MAEDTIARGLLVGEGLARFQLAVATNQAADAALALRGGIVRCSSRVQSLRTMKWWQMVRDGPNGTEIQEC